MNWQGKNLPAGRFRNWQDITISQILVKWLFMNGSRVVYTNPNPFLAQLLSGVIPIRDPNGVLVEYMLYILTDLWCNHSLDL